MTDEEKKAIEMLRNYDNEDNLHKIHQSINVVLNLIEIHSKEIEELKVINQMQKYRIEVIDERELISKDKIKAKIEELEKECKYCEFGKFLCKYCFVGEGKKLLNSLLEKE